MDQRVGRSVGNGGGGGSKGQNCLQAGSLP